MLVLEEYEHAKARGAKIYAELVGYGATSDGYDMVQPSGEGAMRCMKQALKNVKDPVDYVNAHGTSTPVGDVAELKSLSKIFTDYKPWVTSTKSLTGHALGAAGVNEAIYTLLMMDNNFISASANIENLDEACAGVNIATETKTNSNINIALSNSFGFGGTNASLVFQKLT
ncbi:MAG: hypothetical protein KDD50_04270 [Bdellovibrionales bacterium]|nr:hypothetical protein [Bdellovibrionales bacterium]